MKAILERVALALASLLLLALVEGGLRLVGFGSNDYGALDFGIGAADRLFVEDAEHPGMMVVAPWTRPPKGIHRKLINEDTFPKIRPKGELRIIAVGESAVFGYPDGGPTAFPYQVGELVKRAHPEIPVKVIDMGVPGYDARRVLKATREAITFDPSVILFYTGHNEYLRRFTMESLGSLPWKVRARQQLSRLRIYQLLCRILAPITGRAGDVVDVSKLTRELDKHEGFGKPRSALETKLVVQKYRSNIQLAIDAARAAQVPLVLCTVVSDVTAYPMRTVYDEGVTPDVISRAEALRGEILRFADARDFVAMQRKSREALAIVPGHAQFHHYLAQSLEPQGKLDEALQEYVLARDLEATQRRGGVAFNTTIRELGARGGETVVDLEKIWFSDMTHGHWGQTLFLDYCHPNAEGHLIIANAIFQAVHWTELRR